MITLAPNGDVLVGGTGYVEFSKDGGATFSRTPVVESGKLITVVADDDYATNGLIFPCSLTAIYRGKAETTTVWGPSKGSFDSAQSVTGIVQEQEVTYVLTANASDSTLYKCLKLETAASSSLAEWTSIALAGSVYNVTPQALKESVTTTTPKLWMIKNTTTDGLMSITDPIAMVGPTMTSPANEANIPVNPGTGRAYDITFIMGKYDATAVNALQMQIATDSAFNAIVYDNTFTGLTTTTVAKVIGPTGQTGCVAEFMPGSTYYWRVRTGSTAPWYSPWSETRSFKVAPAENFVMNQPAAGASDVGLTPTFTWATYPDAIGYEIVLSEDPTFAIIEWSYNVANNFYATEEALKNSTTYYWRVRGVTGASVLVGSTWKTPAGPWITGIFTTMAEPVEEEAAEPIVITQKETEVKVVEVPITTAPVIPTYILWVIVGIGAILVVALIVLIVRTRRAG
jgi:hypothetical protein